MQSLLFLAGEPILMLPQKAGLITALLCLTFGAFPAPTNAQTAPNTCVSGGRGQLCQNSYNCETNAFATICVDGRCQIPCGGLLVGWQPDECAVGEVCIPGSSDLSSVYFCKPTGFSVDLNILDMCISHFVKGIVPDLSSGNECSLEANLIQLLDQDRDGLFTVFDVDGTIRDFFHEPVCQAGLPESCPEGLIYCGSDEDCGAGSHCRAETNSCARECGFIANRELYGTEYLERQCYGNLKVCDYNRGKCKSVELDNLYCQLDRDCPSQSYCFLGKCEPQCNRSLDCPDANWYCSTTNKCLPVPSNDAEDGFRFDPTEYSLRFGERSIELDLINDAYEIPVHIMSLKTKREVFDNPSVVFGYRLEVSYANKQ